MTPDFNLDGKTALVTGASGGLGRYFAGVLAAAGARVAVCARRLDKVMETVAGIEALSGSGGGKAIGVEMDVTDAASVAQAFEAIEEQAGTVTVVPRGSVTVGTRQCRSFQHRPANFSRNSTPLSPSDSVSAMMWT